MRRFRHRRLLRLAVFALFAIGLVVQPLLASVGELHELTAHAAVEHAHLDVVPRAADMSPQADADDGAPSPDGLHALLHFAHCCGHTPAFVLAAPALLRAPMTAPRPIALTSERVGLGRALTPFRPPIAA